MDRFIECCEIGCPQLFRNLKSNMDRFIARTLDRNKQNQFNLKSNMDRFIAVGMAQPK